jgi:hypothetical protein
VWIKTCVSITEPSRGTVVSLLNCSKTAQRFVKM